MIINNNSNSYGFEYQLFSIEIINVKPDLTINIVNIVLIQGCGSQSTADPLYDANFHQII